MDDVQPGHVQVVAQLASALVPLLSALFAALVVLLGNHRLQRRLGKRLRDVEELRTRLYNLVTLLSDYWTHDCRPLSRRQELEARIVAEKHIVVSQLEEMGNQTKKLKGWHRETTEQRLDLIDAMTGGCFQQRAWSPAPERVALAAGKIHQLVSSLNRKC